MSSSPSEHSAPVYTGAGLDVEKGHPRHIERTITPGGHPADYSQPGITVQHRKYGNPVPVGLIAFVVCFMLVGLFTLQVRGIKSPLVAIPSLILFAGITQTLVGWFEMFIGNTFSATIFVAFGGFGMSYSAIFLPAFGVMAGFTDKEGVISPEFNQAVGVFMVVWACIDLIFVIAALRSSVAILVTLIFVFLAFLFIGITSLTGNDSIRIAGGVFSLGAAICGAWAALAGYLTPDLVPGIFVISPIALSKED